MGIRNRAIRRLAAGSACALLAAPAARPARDFLNPRDVVGFDADLLPGPGLYGFELGNYDRPEAGVVELAWSRAGGPWQRVPTEHLVAAADALPIPEPGTAALGLAATLAPAAFAGWRRRVRA